MQSIVKLINITSDTLICIILPIALNKYVAWLLVYLLDSEGFAFSLSTHLDCEVLTLAPKSQTMSP